MCGTDVLATRGVDVLATRGVSVAGDILFFSAYNYGLYHVHTIVIPTLK
jgi:hypothetical protein